MGLCHDVGVFESPPIRWAFVDGGSVAYQVFGDGLVDLVVVSGLGSQMEMLWELPGFSSFMGRLGQIVATGLSLRGGVHIGEIERRGDDIAGLAVHAAARIESAAPPGEIATSSTVKDLIAGSGITLTSLGTHELKGVPGEWELHTVASGPTTY